MSGENGKYNIQEEAGKTLLEENGKNIQEENGKTIQEETEKLNQGETEGKEDTKKDALTGNEEDYDDGIDGWGKRHILGLLLFLSLTVAYMTRVNLSITIVAMVVRGPIDIHHTLPANLTHLSHTSTDPEDVCPPPDAAEGPNTPLLTGDMDWDEQTQGLILGAFFWGYALTSFAGGRAAEYLGGRVVVGLGTLLPSALALLTPLAISVSKEVFIALRVTQGLTQGVVYPAIHSMLAAWVPHKDRGSFCAVVLSGSTLGTVLALSVGGWLCNTTGWSSVFYLFGSLGLSWGVPWFILTHDLPEGHPGIGPRELAYITKHRTYVTRRKTLPLPFRDIAKSVPFWSVLGVSFGYHYVAYNLLTELPTYFNNIQHFNISNNGLMSATPYIVLLATTIGWGALVSALSTRGLISVGVVRKLSTGIGLYGSAAALLAMMWVRCDSTVALVVMCLAVASVGPVNSGALLSEQDIAPNYAGSLKGLSNTVAAATGFMAPVITGALINHNQTLSAWRVVFGLAAGLSIVSASQYIVFSTDKVQVWNTPKITHDTESQTED